MLPLFVVLLLGPLPSLQAQAADRYDRERARGMLLQVKKDLARYYYDSTFGGIDLEARYRAADSAMGDVGTMPELFGIIAQFVLDLKDSHTNFDPPRRAATVEYGWSWMMIGNECYVTWVKKDSDAEKKGLVIGDRVLAIDGMLPTRQTIHLINYLYYSLNPRPGMRVTVQKSDGARQDLDILAKVTPRQRVVDYTSFWDVDRLIQESDRAASAQRHWQRSFGDSVLVWHFRGFRSGDRAIDDMMDLARRHKTLILDLRNNGGGAETTIQRLIGHFVDREVRIGTIRTRNKREPLTARPARRTPFTGNLIILVNSRSASASEITARYLQLEGRATIVGDRSMGAVMGSRFYVHAAGFDQFLEYAVQVTEQDIIMPDEGRLENAGVIPEFIVLPTGADLAAKRDPQMVKALQLAGIQMDPVEAFKITQARERN